jgi:hypothetical protein
VRPALFTVAAVFGLLEVSAALGDTTSARQEHPWTLRTGAEGAGQDSRAATASVDYAGTLGDAAPSFGASGVHSNAPDNSGGTVTTTGRAYFQYGTSALKGGVAFDDTNDQDFRHSARWTALLDFAGHGWNAQLNVSTRKTDFDGFGVSTADTSRFNPVAALSGTASCSLHDTGYGGSLTYGSDHWTAYVSGTGSHYDSVDCGFNVAVPQALQRLDPNDFQQLAGQFLERAAARSGGRLGQDSRLLASLIGAGVAHHWDRFSVALDYTRSTDEFGGAIQNGYSMTGTFLLNSTLSFDIVAGVTTGGANQTTNDSTTAPYAGAYVTVSL